MRARSTSASPATRRTARSTTPPTSSRAATSRATSIRCRPCALLEALGAGPAHPPHMHYIFTAHACAHQARLGRVYTRWSGSRVCVSTGAEVHRIVHNALPCEFTSHICSRRPSPAETRTTMSDWRAVGDVIGVQHAQNVRCTLAVVMCWATLGAPINPRPVMCQLLTTGIPCAQGWLSNWPWSGHGHTQALPVPVWFPGTQRGLWGVGTTRTGALLSSCLHSGPRLTLRDPAMAWGP